MDFQLPNILKIEQKLLIIISLALLYGVSYLVYAALGEYPYALKHARFYLTGEWSFYPNNHFEKEKSSALRSDPIFLVSYISLKRISDNTDLNYQRLMRGDNTFFIFADIFDGFEFKFETCDIDGDDKTELLIFYASGGNAYNLIIYDIKDDDKRKYDSRDISPWKNSHLVSNRFSDTGIIVSKNIITVYTYNYDNDKPILKIVYEIRNKSLVEKSRGFMKEPE